MTQGTGSYRTLAWGPGTKFAVVSMEGARDLPPVRGRDLGYAERHGAASLADYTDPHALRLTLGLRGDDHTDLEALSEAVRQATPPSAGVSAIAYRNGTRLRFGKPRRRALPEDSEALWRLGQAVIEFFCPDPREYDASVSTATLLLPSAASGFGFNLAMPFGFGSGGIGGDAQLTNLGNVDAPLVVRINGPVTNPTVGINGRTLQLTTTVAAGDFLLIDMEARTVLLNGTASRRSAVVAGSSWPNVPPGTSTLQYRASSLQDPAATLVATYRGAWL